MSYASRSFKTNKESTAEIIYLKNNYKLPGVYLHSTGVLLHHHLLH